MAENKVPPSAIKAGSEHTDETVYESSFVPVMWLVVPFIVVIAYGVFVSR